MANEIQITLQANLTRTNEVLNWAMGSLNFNQTGTRSFQVTETVTTTGGALSLPSIGTLGFIIIKNEATLASATVTLYNTTGGTSFAKLNAGAPMLLPAGPDAQALVAVAASTTATLRIMAFEL